MGAVAEDRLARALPPLPHSWPGRNAGWLALGGFALLLLLTALVIHREGARIRLELDVATQEGGGLQLREDVLRQQLFEAARQLEELESGKEGVTLTSGGTGGDLPRRRPL